MSNVCGPVGTFIGITFSIAQLHFNSFSLYSAPHDPPDKKQKRRDAADMTFLFNRKKIIYQSETIRVYDDRRHKMRNLSFGPVHKFRQSAMLLESPHTLCLNYTKNAFAGVAIVQPLQALVLGVGAGSVIGAISHALPKCSVDAVDLSAEVISVAKTFFQLDQFPNCQFHVRDAAVFVTSREKSYDYIFVDLYDSNDIPSFILKTEFWDHIFEILNDGGLAMLNAPKHYSTHFLRLFSSRTSIQILSFPGEVVGFGMFKISDKEKAQESIMSKYENATKCCDLVGVKFNDVLENTIFISSALPS